MKKILLLITFSALFLSACSSNDGSVDLAKVTDSGTIQYTESFGANLDNITHDWGDISIEGGVVTNSYPFKNSGDSDLIIKTIVTSCMCTSAEVQLADGSVSPTFGMHDGTEWDYAIAPGEAFDVNVMFDPMFHGPDGVGAISRSIIITTSAENVENGQVEIKASANVLYDEDYQTAMEGQETQNDISYENIPASELATMLETKDFFLLDVHIPEQEHIDGTDAFIPYDDIASYISELPEDKDTEIVVYCRSGSMSTAASAELIEMGYTNVKNLEGGVNAYNEL